MRGKLTACRANHRTRRIIPAHAGQTFPAMSYVTMPSDHPRACGANHVKRRAHSVRHGSSPRMRGKLTTDTEQRGGQRIIPAHAGQTSALTALTRSPTDHPRACGANPKQALENVSPNGSSPRMRGKPVFPGSARAGCRIIPAHAGQTRWTRHRRPIPSDHPRACGANGVRGTFDTRGHGSSPRMRGKP